LRDVESRPITTFDTLFATGETPRCCLLYTVCSEAEEEAPSEATVDAAGRFALLLLLRPKLNFHLDVFFCNGAGLADVGATSAGTAASGIDSAVVTSNDETVAAAESSNDDADAKLDPTRTLLDDPFAEYPDPFSQSNAPPLIIGCLGTSGRACPCKCCPRCPPCVCACACAERSSCADNGVMDAASDNGSGVCAGRDPEVGDAPAAR
jgi:hypothetical protein